MLRPMVRGLRDALFGSEFGRKWPRTVTIEGLGPQRLMFKVYSPVEHYRVAQYGGEREFLQKLLGSLEPNDVVYDIGASIGLFTVSAASLLAGGALYAFEPDPDTRARLHENVTLNALKGVHLIEWAAADKEGEAVLHTDGAAGLAPSLVAYERPGAPKGRVRVRTGSIDESVARSELPIPDVMKIDVEGAEMLCLRGCKRVLGGHYGHRPRAIFLELHPDLLPHFGASSEQVEIFMSDIGYELKQRCARDEQEHLLYLRQ